MINALANEDSRLARVVSLAPQALVVLFPFLFFWRLLFPELDGALELANDFGVLYYRHKVWLLDLWAHGNFPLWSPGEGAGFPFFANPFPQAFYPLNLLLLGFYDIAGGYSLYDHEIYTLLGLSIFGLGLYSWLRLLSTNGRAVLFATLVILVSFKLGEILRFPNAVHAVAWMPWILYGVTLATRPDRAVRAGLLLFVAAVMLLTAGYPYFAYYGLFLFPPYALLLLNTDLRAALLVGSQPLQRRRYAAALLLPVVGAAAACSPYLWKVKRLLDQTTDRGGGDYAYATGSSLELSDTVGSLVFPPAAEAEGWFYFGQLGVVMLAMYGVVLWLARRQRGAELRLAASLVVWCLLLTSLSYAQGWVFDLLWHVLPGFSSLRMWGRINVLLLPILAVLLVRAYAIFEEVLAERSARRTRVLIPVVVVTAVVVVATQARLWASEAYDDYWRWFFSYGHGGEYWFVLSAVVAAVVVLGLLAASRLSRRRPAGLGLLAILTTVTVIDLYPVGSRQWMRPASENVQAARGVFRFDQLLPRSLFIPRVRTYDTITVPEFNVGRVANWYYARYLAFERSQLVDFGSERDHRGVLDYGVTLPVSSRHGPQETRAYRRLLGLEDGKRVYLSARIDHPTVGSFLMDADSVGARQQVQLEHYDGDLLRARVRCQTPVYFSFIDNWDPDWVGRVDGDEVGLAQLFGTFKSMPVPPGDHQVELEYRPFW